jgi:hypothetical protein
MLISTSRNNNSKHEFRFQLQLFLVLIFDMGEKNVSHKYGDPSGNKAATALRPKEG